MANHRLNQVIDDYLFGEALPDELAELEQAIQSDPEVRDQFWDRVGWHISVSAFTKHRPVIQFAKELSDFAAQLPAGACSSGSSKESKTDSELPAAAPLDAAPPLAASPPPASPVLGFLGGVVDYVNHSRRLMFLLVAVMLSGWFVFQVGSVLLGRWFAGDPQMVDQGPDHSGAPVRKPDAALAGGTPQSHGNAVAWLSGSVGARWQVVAANSPGQEFWELGTEFRAAQQVNLVAGLAEITFHSGAKVVVSAPAQFSVASALGTELQVGKLSARVPHTATGFTVNTPAGSVVDLGTEFGVEVTPDHKLDVQVFVGEVKISSAAGSDDAAPGPDVHVGAGKTVHVEPGHPTTVVESKDKDRFQRDLKIDSDSTAKQMAAYLDLMRTLKPAAWYRMEGKDADRTLRDEIGSADGKLTWDGPGNPFVKGRVGKGLWFRGPQLGDYAVVPDYPKAEHGKLSVSAWVFADSRPNWSTIVGNWRQNTAEGQFSFGLYSGNAKPSVDLFVGITPAEGRFIYLREGESHPFPLHEWQHVAFTTDGSSLRLYRQGREVGSLTHEGLKYPVPIRSLGIGATFDGSDKTPGRAGSPGWWDGKVDEIAIFNEVLSAEDIQKLAAAPPP